MSILNNNQYHYFLSLDSSDDKSIPTNKYDILTLRIANIPTSHQAPFKYNQNDNSVVCVLEIEGR